MYIKLEQEPRIGYIPIFLAGIGIITLLNDTKNC
jgi:hypothetical protein